MSKLLRFFDSISHEPFFAPLSEIVLAFSAVRSPQQFSSSPHRHPTVSVVIDTRAQSFNLESEKGASCDEANKKSTFVVHVVTRPDLQEFDHRTHLIQFYTHGIRERFEKKEKCRRILKSVYRHCKLYRQRLTKPKRTDKRTTFVKA